MHPQTQLALEMQGFVQAIPADIGLEWVKDYEFLFYFEAERMLAIRGVLAQEGFESDREFSVLDVGYLHGLVSEFVHRAFPKAKVTVIDHPNSPIFRNPGYLRIIE